MVRAGCFGRSPPGLLVEDRLDLRVVDVALVVPILTTLLVDRVFFRSSSGPAGTGSGVAATQARSVPPYTGVDLAGDNNVIVQVGARQSVIVHADSYLLRRVTTRVRSGRLVIGTTPGNLSVKSPMFVAVSLPSLDRLRLQGDGNISATAINSRNLTVALPGSGNVHATGARRDDQRRGNRSAAPAHRATYGWSGGGPHALACAALLAGRCAAAATIAGVGPATAPDLDWLAGMGEGNVAEVAAARDGRERLTEYCRADADGIMAAGPEQLADAFRPHLSDVDSQALTGELAAFLLESMTAGLESGVEGWVDDDFAFLAPWGLDVEAIRVPVLVWQGGQDLMVPTDHARWLRQHVAGAEGGVMQEEGHLTLFAHRVGDVHEWLRHRLS